MCSGGIYGVEVEAHFRPLFLDSPLRNHRLQKWFKENEQFGLCDAKIGDSVLPVPAVSFNAIYQLTHIYTHMFDEGIGLRQLLDYSFVLRALHIEQETLSGSPLKGERPDHWQSMAQWAEGMGIAVKSNEEIMHTLGRFGMKKFAGAVMWVLARVFEPNDNGEDDYSLRYDDDDDDFWESERIYLLNLRIEYSKLPSFCYFNFANVSFWGV